MEHNGLVVGRLLLDSSTSNKQTEKRETTKKTRNAKNATTATTATAKTTIHEQMPEEMKRNEMKIKEDKNRNWTRKEKFKESFIVMAMVECRDVGTTTATTEAMLTLHYGLC